MPAPNARPLLVRATLPLAAALALALAACGGAEENYEPDAVDVGEGELIVADDATAAPSVDLPDTPMTPEPTAAPAGTMTTPVEPAPPPATGAPPIAQ